MAEPSKLSIKRVEVSLIKFNDVIVPHHVDILNKHKDNILKYNAVGDNEKVKKEQVNASRVIKQLKQTLYEIEMIKGQVTESDHAKFDKSTEKSIQCAKAAINEYYDSVSSINEHGSLQSAASQEFAEQSTEKLQIIKNSESNLEAEEEIEKLEKYYTSMEDLQNEVQEIQELFTELNSVVHRQGEHVNVVENNIENAQENINQGARHLALAAKFKPAFYPLAGALIGTCVGGPIGLIAGFKVGGAAAMGCGVLGFTGGQILKKRKHIIMQDVDKKQQ